MSCAECERANQGRRTARVKRWAGVIFVVGVVAFVDVWLVLLRGPGTRCDIG
jgi:hypothetical protein